MYIEKAFPTMTDKISHNLSPMAEIAKYIKDSDPTAKVVFIGPCTAKKMEVQWDKVKPYVDYAMTFEELQAIFCLLYTSYLAGSLTRTLEFQNSAVRTNLCTLTAVYAL